MLPERLWRVRKNSRTMEALLYGAPGGPEGAVEVKILYNGEPMLAQRWSERRLAIEEAGRRLEELLLSGWATHW